MNARHCYARGASDSESSLDAGQEHLVERLDAVGCEEEDAAIVLGVVQTKMVHENCGEVVDVGDLQNGE
jgi:hypothetical protein